jgi:hypothetical protein
VTGKWRTASSDKDRPPGVRSLGGAGGLTPCHRGSTYAHSDGRDNRLRTCMTSATLPHVHKGLSSFARHQAVMKFEMQSYGLDRARWRRTKTRCWARRVDEHRWRTIDRNCGGASVVCRKVNPSAL